MKEWIGKHIWSWLLGFINFRIYTSDSIDDLVYKLNRLDLAEQANQLSYLYRQVLIWEQFKTICMFLSIVFLFVAHLEQLEKILFFCWQKLIQPVYIKLKTKFKKS